jgi:hypothetical protein
VKRYNSCTTYQHTVSTEAACVRLQTGWCAVAGACLVVQLGISFREFECLDRVGSGRAGVEDVWEPLVGRASGGSSIVEIARSRSIFVLVMHGSHNRLCQAQTAAAAAVMEPSSPKRAKLSSWGDLLESDGHSPISGPASEAEGSPSFGGIQAGSAPGAVLAVGDEGGGWGVILSEIQTEREHEEEEAMIVFENSLPLIPCFREVLEMSARTDPDTNPEVHQIAAEMHECCRIRSLVEQAEQAGVGRNTFQRTRPRLSCLATIIDRWLRARLEMSITSRGPEVELLMYLVTRSYDETPLTVATKEAAPVVTDSEGQLLSAVGAGVVALPPQVHRARSLAATDVGTSKISQTSSGWAMLIRIGAKYISLRGDTVNWLQALGRGTAEVLHAAIKATSGISAAAADFPKKVCLVCTDSYSANFKKERFAGEREAGYAVLQTMCHVHKSSTCHTRTFSMVDGEVSGVIRYALSLSLSECMHRFRESLRHIILERLEVRRGEPPVEAAAFREATLDLFLKRGPYARSRRAILATVLNGDWRDREHVQVYLVPGDQRDEAAIRTQVVNEVCWALAGRVPHTYPRHRWTGACRAFDDVGLVQSVHGLAAAAYQHWLAKPAERSGDDPHPPLGAEQHLAEPPPGSLPQSSHPEAITPHSLEGVDPVGPSAATWADVNQANKVMARDFLASGKVDLVPILRLVVEPLSQLLEGYLFLGGERWEAQQRRKEALAPPSASSPWLKARTHRILVAAEQDLECTFEERVSLLPV